VLSKDHLGNDGMLSSACISLNTSSHAFELGLKLSGFVMVPFIGLDAD